MLHPHPLKRDRRPCRSTLGQERPLLATSMCLVPAHVPCCVTTPGLHHPCAPCLRNYDTRARETARVVPPPPGRAHLHLIAFIGHRLPSQANTCLFCTLCPH